MEKLKELWQKLRSIKNFEIILSLIIIAVVLLIYFSVSENDTSSSASNEAVDSSVSLTDGLEERLGDILSKIEGVGEVDVLITYSSTEEQVTASTNNSHSTTTGATTTTTSTLTPIISNQNVIVLQEKMPEIMGVIVVAEGANDVGVKLKILSAVSTALDINQNSIQIFTRRDL